MGEPTRIITGGIRPLPGRTMAEKRDFFASSLDHLRTSLILEPRGHRDMFGALLCEPADPGADIGVFFMDSSGYLDMCGHGSIGAVTVALEMGIIEAAGPVADLVLDSPSGLIHARAEIENGAVQGVNIRNVPSFVVEREIILEVPGYGEVPVQIAYGGNLFALIDADALGIETTSANTEKLTRAGMRILNLLHGTIEFRHPETGMDYTVNLVEFYSKKCSDRAHARNIVIFGNAQFDRSPCGTGTCAKMAALHAQGSLKIGEDFVYESIIGTTFTGRLVGETRVGDIEAVIPEINSRAFITGIQHFLIYPDDPLRHGFIPAATDTVLK